MSYGVTIEGLANLKSMDDVKDNIGISAVRAINKTAERARARSATEIRQQVAFSAQYLAPSGGRLTVTKQATRADLSSVITGRDRPTSLARFSSGGATRGAGVRVEVAPGRSRYMKRAFLIKLRAGTGSVESKFNMGLAIRLRAGETIQNKKKAVKMEKGLYLLYGPSVAQVFRTVSQDIAPAMAQFLEGEFIRQVGR